MANRLSDAELVELVQQKTPEELSLDEIEQLRSRLHNSPDLQRTLIEQLHLESYLNTALGQTRISASEIMRRANAVNQPKRPWTQWALWTGLAAILIGIGFVVWRGKDPERPQVVQNESETETTEEPQTDPIETAEKVDVADAGPQSDQEPIDVALAPSDTNSVANANPNANANTSTENEAAVVKIEESAPWFEGLHPGAQIQTVSAVSLDPPAWIHRESFFKAEAVQWWKSVPGHGLRIDEREVHGVHYSYLQGMAKLQAPWVDEAVLRVGLYDHDQPQFHFWNGVEGVSIRGYFNFTPRSWLAFVATREAGKPQPKTIVLHDCDDGIYSRTAYGPIEFRWQDGELVLSRGDVRMLTVPMEKPPTEVYFEGKAQFSECQMYRGEPLPDQLPEPNARLVDSTRPADWDWLTDQSPDGRKTLHDLGQGRRVWRETIAEGVTVEAHDSGDVSLAVEATEQIQMATAYTPGRQFREIICRIEDIAPGTGLTLVSDSNTVMQRLAVVKDRKTGRLLLSSQNPYQKDSEIDHDFNSRFSPVIEDGQWLRIVPGFQSIAVYTSRDAIHWGRAMHHPIRSMSQRVTSIGLFVYPTKQPTKIRLNHLEVRELDAISSLASIAIREQVPKWDWEDFPNDAEWHRRVLTSRPNDVSLADWQRACAVEFLLQHEWCELSSNLLRGLIDAGLSSETSADEKIRLLNEVALLFDLWGTREANSFVRMYYRLAEILSDDGHPTPFRTVMRTLVTAPIWTESSWKVAEPDFVREHVVQEVFRENWSEVWASTREAHFWNTSSNPHHSHPWVSADSNLLQWAETLAARNDATLDTENRWGSRGRGRRRGGWLPPLVTQLSKEGYNVMAEFEAAIRSEAWEDACRIVTSVNRGGMLGLLPDARDEQLLVSLPRAIALTMQEYPELGREMKSEFEAVGRLRVREAITQSDAATIEAATVRFYGTEAAAEAHRWLGDQAIAAGRFEQAVNAYENGLHSATGELAEELTNRLSLATSFLGNAPGELPGSDVSFNQTHLPGSEFDALLADLQTTHARTVEGNVNTSTRTVSVPAPSRYTVRELALFGGDLGTDKPNSHNRETDMVGRQFALTIAGDRVYVSNRFQVTAYNRQDGTEVWRRGVGGEQTSINDWPGVAMKPLVVGNSVFVRRLSKRGIELVCLAADNGEVRWTQRPDGQIVTDPIDQTGKLLAVVATTRQAGLIQMELTSFQPETGEVLSQRTIVRLRDEWNGRPACQLAAIDGKLVLTTGGATVAMDSLGNAHWLFQQPWLPNSAEADRDRKYAQPPVFSGETIFTVPPGTRELVALELANGRKLWSHPMPGIVRLINSTDEAVIVQTQYGFEAFRVTDGETLWQHNVSDICYGISCDKSQLLFVRMLAIGEGIPCLVWLDLKTGKETSHTTLDALADQVDRVGPLVVDKDRLLTLVGKGHEDNSRRLVELQPESGEIAGPLLPSDLTDWLGNVVPEAMHAVARVLPGWTLLNEQSPRGREDEPLFQPEFRGETDVLATQTVKTPVCFAREMDPDAKQLEVRVGHRSGEAWTLIITADGRELLRVPVDDQTAPDGWLSRSVDVSEFTEGNWLTITQSTDGEQKPRFAYWKHAKFQ